MTLFELWGKSQMFIKHDLILNIVDIGGKIENHFTRINHKFKIFKHLFRKKHVFTVFDSC